MSDTFAKCECGGVLSGVVADYQMELSDGHVISVPSTPFAKCNKCGECELPPETWEKLDSAIAKHKYTQVCQIIMADDEVDDPPNETVVREGKTHIRAFGRWRNQLAEEERYIKRQHGKDNHNGHQ